ncbi:hypothetical protein A4A49_53218 [Nicotiana attenuata]|uniref:Uncharacterized protein n=1 Tax=Nicotiana attenuata TaxID=49451 RepID=A0A314KQA5_NICAT|nr:hypothetical protein A4A49_53218 [Nicotiana attenuata]
MANQITLIDLDADEFEYKKSESYQDKTAKLEAKVAMEQEIDGVKEAIADHKNSSNKEGYSLFRTKGHSKLPTMCMKKKHD